MNDRPSGGRPSPERLFDVASQQAGYFTTDQARECGYSWALLSYHVKKGRFFRVRRGLYRLRQFPSSPRQEIIAAWLAVGSVEAVVSHESALDIHGLSDVVPSAIHLTLPRSRRYLRVPPGVTIHTTTRRLESVDVLIREGMRVTSPVRSILDSAEAGTAPEQIVLAVKQALQRGLVSRREFMRAASSRVRRVEQLVRRVLNEASP